MRHETKHANITTGQEIVSGTWYCMIGVFDPARKGKKSPDSLLRWGEERGLYGPDEALRAAQRIEEEVLGEHGYNVKGEELTDEEKIARDPGGYCDYVENLYEEQQEAQKTYAEYDAANGYELDDEGNSYHDYS